MVIYDCEKNGRYKSNNFRAEGFPEELVDNEPEKRGHEI